MLARFKSSFLCCQQSAARVPIMVAFEIVQAPVAVPDYDRPEQRPTQQPTRRGIPGLILFLCVCAASPWLPCFEEHLR